MSESSAASPDLRLVPREQQPVALAVDFAEAAAMLRCSVRSIRCAAASGDLRSFRIGRAQRVSTEELRSYLRRLERGRQAPALMPVRGRRGRFVRNDTAPLFDPEGKADAER
jgi:excisionase family DNA binding protein